MTAEPITPVNAPGRPQPMSQAPSIQTGLDWPAERVPEGNNRPANATDCRKCGGWWTGFNACHCTACHRTFTGIAAFDRHRTGSHAADTRHCLDPETVLTEKGDRALVAANRAWPGWSLPGTWEGPEA